MFQISASATYGIPEFKVDLLSLYARAGAKGTKLTFLLTDSNIVDERFLVYINDLLSTGHIADLCSPVRRIPLESFHTHASCLTGPFLGKSVQDWQKMVLILED